MPQDTAREENKKIKRNEKNKLSFVKRQFWALFPCENVYEGNEL